MIFNDHSKFADKHAILSPSGYTWMNYSDEDPEQLRQRVIGQYATSIGTIVHDQSEFLIKHAIKLSKSDKKMVYVNLLKQGIPEFAIDMDWIFENMCHYVNDAIGYRLKPEVTLYYSDYCFGKADAIDFKNGFLRIHDLKTGKTTAHMEQLFGYAALFCLEYGYKPMDIQMELRIYQAGEMVISNPVPEDIDPIMSTIITKSRYLEKLYSTGE